MVILVTGASSGLGKYTAEEYVKKGHIVYGTSRNPQDMKNGVNMIRLDVCDDISCKEAVEHILHKEGRIDVLVNNAGMGIAGSVEMTSDEEAKSQFETNFFGVLRMCREVIPVMRKQRSGKIINISSAAAVIPIPFQSMYSAGKAAIESVSSALNMELKAYGISVSSIEFGDMKTGFTKNRIITKASTDDEAGERVYSDIFIKSLHTMEKDEQNGPEPIQAAKLIVRISLRKNPKSIVVCGFKYKLAVMLRRFLPIRFTDWIIGLMYA